ncbi:MAG: formate dehydrogenase accessory protein FdhE [Deltaproteobacteria bacterium]|nr:formate dehydrogenase accessory protein FdhE [Deltaproteobacteria bacterium]
MRKRAERLSRLEKQIEQMIEMHPHSQNILTAFKTILLERKRLIEAGNCMSVEVSQIDTVRLQGGVPVSRQTLLLHPDEPWNEIALAMIPSIASGFPTLTEELKKIEDDVRGGDVHLKDYFTPFPDLDEEMVRNWTTTLNIRSEPLHLLLMSILRPVLEMKARDVVAQLGDFSWDKGYCPICGAFPDIAVIKDKITQRWLRCPRCRHAWHFNRVLCPYCEHEGKEEGTTYFFVEGKEQETAFICERCNRYLLTLNRVSDLGDPDFDVISMGLTHIDMIMQEKGYTPVVFTEWNDFRAQQ